MELRKTIRSWLEITKTRNLPAGKSFEIIKEKPQNKISPNKKYEIDFSFLEGIVPYTCNYCKKEYESKDNMKNYCEMCHYGMCNQCYEVLMKNIKK